MAKRPASAESSHRHITFKLLASAAVVALLPACTPSLLKSSKAPTLNVAEKPRPALTPTNPLHKATAYWAEQHKKKPNDPQAALNYAKNLKAVGSRGLAISVLQQAHAKHPAHKEIASEYGRLVLEADKPQLALRVLKQAEQPNGKTDWRVMSAQGTAHAKMGEHETAQRYFAAALQKKPDSASLRNNLALSYAMSGSPDKAEKLLRDTIKGGYDTARVRQNLALVLGLQGKFNESQKLASVDLPTDKAESNVTYLRSLVRDREVAQAQLTAQAKVASVQPRPQSVVKPTVVAAAAPTPQRRPRTLAPQSQSRQLTSKSLPLPWAKRAPQTATAISRTAQANPVPLPQQKPSPSTQSAKAPAEPASSKRATAPQPAAAERPAPLPWHQPAPAQDRKIAVASWQTRVIAEAAPSKAGPGFKPFPSVD